MGSEPLPGYIPFSELGSGPFQAAPYVPGQPIGAPLVLQNTLPNQANSYGYGLRILDGGIGAVIDGRRACFLHHGCLARMLVHGRSWVARLRSPRRPCAQPASGRANRLPDSATGSTAGCVCEPE